MLALFAVLMLIPLLYLPGSALSLALLRERQSDGLERVYERVVLGALLNGWLALVLAEFGIFSAPLHLFCVALIALFAAWVAFRRGRLQLPTPPLGIVSHMFPAERHWSLAGLRQRLLRHWDSVGFALIGLLFLLLVARPFEVILGARDAGVYALTGAAIARTGGIVQYDPLVAQIAADQQSSDQSLREAAEQAETNFLGTQNRERFIAPRLRVAGFMINEGDLAQGRVVPQFFHLYPAWIGLLASMLGLQGGLFITGWLGFLGVWSVGMLGRRLAGPLVGLLAALLLAINGVQVWFSRYSMSESTVQFLGFAACYAFAVMATEAAAHEKHSAPGRGLDRASFAALLCGLAAGQWALARIDFFLIIPLLLVYLLYRALSRRWRSADWFLFGGLFAMLLHAALHIIFIARAYFFDTGYARFQDKSAIIARLVMPFLTDTLREIYVTTPRSVLKNPLRLPLEIVALILLIGFCIWLRWDGRLLRLAERLATRSWPWVVRLGAVGLLLLGSYAYLIRPQILTPEVLAAAPSCLSLAQLRQPQGACLALQGYIGAPIASPAAPNPVAYLLDSLPKWLRGAQAPAVVRSVPAEAEGELHDLPNGGNLIATVQSGETLQVRSGSEADAAFLVMTAEGTPGWVDARRLSFEQSVPETFPRRSGVATIVADTALLTATVSANTPLLELPVGGTVQGQLSKGNSVQVLARSVERLSYLVTNEQSVTGWVSAATLVSALPDLAELPNASARVVSTIVNPREATQFSFGNPGESEKIGIAQANFVRFGWYLSPLGVLLGILGVALWWWRGLNRASWLFFAVALAASYFYLRLSYGTSDQTYIYILRRYIPQVYPAFCLAIAYALVALAAAFRSTLLALRWRSWLGFRRITAAGIVLVLLLFLLATNRTIYRHVEFDGAIEQISALAEQFDPQDVLLLRGGNHIWATSRDLPDLVTTPLIYGFGRNAFTIKSEHPDNYATQLARYVQRWQEQGRQVYMILGASGALALPGLQLEPIDHVTLHFPEMEPLTDQKPSNIHQIALDYTIYRVTAGTNALFPTSPFDYAAQVRGFYPPETLQGTDLAWTDGDALLRIPAPQGDAPLQLTITLAAGVSRPVDPQVHVTLSWRPELSYQVDDPSAPAFAVVGELEIGQAPGQYTVTIDPSSLPHSTTGTLLLRIQSDTWIPAAADPAQHDQRTLGVLFGGLIEP